MSFNAALSGLRAASTDLKVTGNNIANASTTGFKSSRVEFGDVFASSVLGSGNAQTGGGSRVQDIAQQFSQGNISFTSSQLDLAISGQGFFMINQNDSTLYSRAGTFSLDDQGCVVNNSGGRLQGFESDRFGNFSGVVSDIRIETGNQEPRQTTGVTSSLNLDSAETVLQRNGVTFDSTGPVIAKAQVGNDVATNHSVAGTLAPSTFDYSTTNVSFTIDLNGITQDINLTTNTSTLDQLVVEINSQIFAEDPPLDVYAEKFNDGTNDVLRFVAFESGSTPDITITNLTAAQGGAIGFGDVSTLADVTTAGEDAAVNGYTAQSFTLTNAKGVEVEYSSKQNASAASTAAEINNLAGMSASALTKAVLDTSASTIGDGFVLNNVTLTGNTYQDIVDDINSLTTSTLPGISAEIDANGDVVITSIVGDDLKFSLVNDGNLGSLSIAGGDDLDNATAAALTVAGDALVVGGVIDVVMDEGYSISNLAPKADGLFTTLAISTADLYSINAFDPADPSTYNHATSVSVYDSLGEAHVMTQYFVKQEFDPTDPTKNEPNVWKMYVQIDGEDVGDPDTSLPPPQNTLATQAAYTLRFNPDGTLNAENSSQLLVSNWTPKTADGELSGALGPINRLEGATFPVEEPAVSSNFSIDMSRTTQFSSDFAVNNVDQNGYTTGLLTGLSIDAEGIIFARYTNGESVALSQLALANFDNPQGLQPQGDSMWAENFESGEALVASAGSGSLGVIQAGALEESNVDLSEQLVNLIIAQRNFQANAKTIETANQITQTIINLR